MIRFQLFLPGLHRGGGTVAPETREAITAMLGQGGGNIFQQYIDYLKNIFTGNWGVSVTYFPNQVTTSIASALPWTICLVGTTTIISFFIQQALGIWAGWRRVALLITSFPLCPPFSKLFLTSGLHSSSFGCLPVRCIGSLSQADTIIVRLCPASLGNSSRAAVRYAILPALTILVSSLGMGVVG